MNQIFLNLKTKVQNKQMESRNKDLDLKMNPIIQTQNHHHKIQFNLVLNMETKMIFMLKIKCRRNKMFIIIDLISSLKVNHK
jgi:hypothetical protein